MPSWRTNNNFPEGGRGLGHVTPTIFGNTVGYPSDSLASCSFRDTIKTMLTRSQAVATRYDIRQYYLTAAYLVISDCC